ncbi:MAG: R.Pab1 family restriction endonuclease [Candidatus Omnitrophica bacterium]|nr:R.Pab1 family restriction endonuclease [Candidatus Omnitrophota bacterium]
MPNYPATIEVDNSSIVIGLPLTTPKGKTRIKVKSNSLDFGTPFYTGTYAINENCYAEWQIGYDNSNLDAEGVAKEVTFHNSKGEYKYGAELTAIFYKGLKNNIFAKGILNDLISFANSVSQEDLIEENVSISRVTLGSKALKGLTFHIIEEKYPLYLLIKSDYEIEVVVQHKQRAVGYQAMIYVCLPIKNAEEKVIGRPAKPKEFIHFKVNQTENNFVFDAFKVFSLASKKHNEDIKSILAAINGIL